MSEESFTMDEQATGKLFEQARIAKGLSIQQVASELKLPKQTLQKLEKLEDLAEADVYQRGYLKRYARLLGLDWASDQRAVHATPVPAVTDLLPRKQAGLPSWTLPVLGAVFVAGGLWYQRAVPVTQPVESPPQLQSAREKAAVVQPEKNVEEVVLLAGMEQEAVEKTSAPVSAQPAARSLSPIREARAEVQPDLLTTEAEQPAEHYLLQFSGDSWVEVRDASGQRLAYRLFHAGERLPLKGQPPYDMLIGDHTQARLRMDGQVVDLSAFARGKVVRINTGSLQGGQAKSEIPSGSIPEALQGTRDTSSP